VSEATAELQASFVLDGAEGELLAARLQELVEQLQQLADLQYPPCRLEIGVRFGRAAAPTGG